MPFSNFFKKNNSLASLSCVAFQLLLLPQSSASSSSIFFIHLLLQSSSCASPWFHLLHCSWRFCFLAFQFLHCSSRFCIGLWVWFFFAFLLHLRHLASSSRYVSPSRCFFFLHCCRRWQKPPLGSCWAVTDHLIRKLFFSFYGSPDL